ncbi:FAD-dependent monooxygenase [Mycolicibacterium wolinskyi]|uniref:Monooxygenase n=1 Tax=Mycolicibacterium wolinskyi TaxID=59750 RepID=A0A1X2EXV2_9MYCO|nr:MULTISPECIES: FAD-dependent monooxygenase [Mycolicibacterium]MCV7285036.1 FAD-dependent monooxygenase [Mycolicibacterium wolinskyi]MCV7292160.1 FAD-dependent monooxygenase [Mycolicibacterium goodii]ORX11091.1 monooxygenase [Mycolicibacterium wolinskyi]
MDTESVVIVGAGAAGSTLALLLARYGIPSTVIEERIETRLHPAAHVINARTLEIWNQASPGLGSALEAITPPIDTVNIIRWCTDVRSDPIGEIDLLSQPDRLAEVRTHSAYLISHIGQHLLMPVLWNALEGEPLVDFRRGVRAGLVGDGLTLRFAGADPVVARPRFVIAADGANSRLRDAAGIAMTGPVLANMGSVFFHAPQLYPNGTSRPLLSWIYHPRFSGVMIAHADDDYVLMTPYLHPAQWIARDSRSYWNHILPNVIGSTDYQIRSTGTWTMTKQIADRFRRGPLLLIGDAAHRFPHTGGFGLNSGVQDAHNLAWKLAAILQDGASESLLDTYETERRPVVTRFAEQSTINHFRLDEVTAPLGITNTSLHKATELIGMLPLGWVPGPVIARVADALTTAQTSRTRRLLRNSARSSRLRERMAAAVPGQEEHFVASGLEFGYAYASPLIDTAEGRCPDGDVALYHPTTHPGARLPHAIILGADDSELSTHAAVARRGLTLFTGDARGWTDALTRTPTTVALTVVALRAAGDDGDRLITEMFEVGGNGAVVARPDGHVVWRTRTGPQAVGLLHSFIERSWRPVYPGAGADVTQHSA